MIKLQYQKMLWHWEVLAQLMSKEFKIKYKSTFLGYVWSIGTPLCLAFILDIAFRHVMRIQIENYSLFLLSALFAWHWFSNSVQFSNGSFLINASIIKKLNFPRFLVPLSSILVDGLHFLFAIPIIMLFLWVHDKPIFHLSWLMGIPLLLIIQTMICYGIALTISSINTIFRDMERIVGLGLTLLLYLTPVLFPLSMVPEDFKVYFHLNPVTNIIESWRLLFLEGHLDASLIFGALLTSIIVLIIGGFTYNKLSPRFAEVL